MDILRDACQTLSLLAAMGILRSVSDTHPIYSYAGKDYIHFSSKCFIRDLVALMHALLWPCRVFTGTKESVHFKTLNFNCMR